MCIIVALDSVHQGLLPKLDMIIILLFADIDECSRQISICDANAVCTNTIGSHICMCTAGFIGNGFFCSKLFIFMEKETDIVHIRLRTDFDMLTPHGQDLVYTVYYQLTTHSR